MAPLPKMLSQYLALCKLKVVALIVFTAWVGMLLSVPGWVPVLPMLTGLLGIGMAAASAAALNHLLDRKADAVMARTKHRPLPSGSLTSGAVVGFSLLLAALAMVILVLGNNALTAVLTFFSLIGYAVIYTVFLKRATPQNIVIGGAAGAAPPVLGWVAITGELHPYALLLFLIIFIWTPPHFWALAVYRREEYAAVNIPMLPVTHGEEFTRLQILLYTVLLCIITVMPYLVGMSGLFYLIGAIALDAAFLVYAWLLYRRRDDLLAMRTFGFSVFYLMALFTFLLIDHYINAVNVKVTPIAS